MFTDTKYLFYQHETSALKDVVIAGYKISSLHDVIVTWPIKTKTDPKSFWEFPLRVSTTQHALRSFRVDRNA